jgi:nucleoside-diphosphate-sugar epimerase
MSEILVTGGNGFVGKQLVSALQERGYAVRVIALPTEDTTWLEGRGVAVYPGDIRQRESLVRPMRHANAVMHLAGLMGVWRPIDIYRSVNVTGTENVCRAALAEGVQRIVHVSSWTVYGMGIGQVVSEDFPLRPLREPYAVTKTSGDIAVQRMIAEDRLPAVIIRPGTIFGPGDQLNFGRTADRLRTRKRVIVGSGSNALPLVYVTDVIQGLLLALNHNEAVGQAYNITNDRPLTQRQFLEAIAREIGQRSPRLHVPYRALYAAACGAERFAEFSGTQDDPIVTRHGVALFGTDNRHAIEKAGRDLGYHPQVDLREGVRRAAQWYRERSHPDVEPRPAIGHPDDEVPPSGSPAAEQEARAWRS